MTLELPAWMQENDYSARLDRALISAIFGEGVLTGFVVSQRAAGANMSVDVSAGVAIVDGDDQANQHSYLLESTAVENRAVSAAPGSNSRIDLVVLQVNDTNAGGGSGDNFQILVIAGSAAASPTPPATPDSAIVLAQILVTSSTSSIVNAAITDVRSFATLRHDVVDDANASRLGTNVATPGAIMRRDGAGRVSIVGPIGPAHAANREYVDGEIAAVTPAAASTTVGSMVYVRWGRVVFATGSFTTSATIPAGYRPAATTALVGRISSTTFIAVDAESSGSMAVVGSTGLVAVSACWLTA